MSLGPPVRDVILTLYQDQPSAYAADNHLVAPPLNWVVRNEAYTIPAVGECIKFSTVGGRWGQRGEYPLAGIVEDTH